MPAPRRVRGGRVTLERRYAKVAQIKKFAILDRDLSVDAGELTPTLTVKRRVVDEKYADVPEALYAG